MHSHPLAALALSGFVLFAGGCTSDDAPVTEPQGWRPGLTYPSDPAPNARGYRDVRGIIHAHSVYSHDACDGAPRDEVTGAINEPCFDAFRAALCRVHHEFVMLTNHAGSFQETEYPETLLYRADRGDELIVRGGAPAANWAGCPDGGAPTLLMAGTETGLMPVGLELHVGSTIPERDAAYHDVSAAAVTSFAAAGAVTLAQHTEDWTPAELESLPIDGFEMYNLHANAITGAGGAVALLTKLGTPEALPHPDLTLLPIVNEDAAYLERWGSVLASGTRRVTTMGSDCHANTFPQILADGERIDGYRRVMQWFSNHLRVTPDAAGHFDDRAVKEALRAGRLYGVFEVLGYPEGFDWYARAGAAEHEIGEAVAAGAHLLVARPTVRDLDPSVEPPRITARLLRAKPNGWDVVAEADGDLDYTAADPGAYRAEIRIEPRHLAPYLASFANLANESFVWIYGDAIYVTP